MTFKRFALYCLIYLVLLAVAYTPFIWLLAFLIVVLDFVNLILLAVVCDRDCRAKWRRYFAGPQNELRGTLVFVVVTTLAFGTHWTFLGPLIFIAVYVGWFNMSVRIAKSYLRDAM